MRYNFKNIREISLGETPLQKGQEKPGGNKK